MGQDVLADSYYDEDTLHEECGVFGMYDFDGNDVASTIYYGLFALQHRGQESCGIAVSDTSGPMNNVSVSKGMESAAISICPTVLSAGRRVAFSLPMMDGKFAP